MVVPSRSAPERYEILLKLASGGMGSVYVARMRGAMGFRQLVAIKKPHAHLLEDPKARQAFVDEAKLTSAVRHVNVVTMRDVDHHEGEVALVMDYVEGGSMVDLLRDTPRMPVAIAIRIALDACAGLHAAHEARDDTGTLLAIVHRDVSPHNILVGTDGVTRVTDFGIAKALGKPSERTASGGVKGKLAYMAPEYLEGERPDRRVDIFALGVVLWEALEGRRLFRGSNDLETLDRLLKQPVPRSEHAGPMLNEVLVRALERNPAVRFQTADEFADALDNAARSDGYVTTQREVGAFVKERVGATLATRLNALREAHRQRQQTTGSMSAIVVPPIPEPIRGTHEDTAPASLPRVSQTIDLGPAKGEFALVDSGLTPTGDSSRTPEPVEESLNVLAPPKASRSLAVPVLAAALLGSLAAVAVWRATQPSPTVPATNSLAPVASPPTPTPPVNPPTVSSPAPSASQRDSSPSNTVASAAPASPPGWKARTMRIPAAVTVSSASAATPLRTNPYEKPSPD